MDEVEYSMLIESTKDYITSDDGVYPTISKIAINGANKSANLNESKLQKLNEELNELNHQRAEADKEADKICAPGNERKKVLQQKIIFIDYIIYCNTIIYKFNKSIFLRCR